MDAVRFTSTPSALVLPDVALGQTCRTARRDRARLGVVLPRGCEPEGRSGSDVSRLGSRLRRPATGDERGRLGPQPDWSEPSNRKEGPAVSDHSDSPRNDVQGLVTRAWATHHAPGWLAEEESKAEPDMR
jgi:hypothetical protein